MFLARAFKHVRKWRRAKKQVGINQEKQNILDDSLDAPSEFVSRSSPSKFSRLVKCDQIKMFIAINTSRTFLGLQSDFICRGSMAQLDRRALRPVARSTQLGNCCKRLWNESDILRDFARLDRKCSSCFLSIGAYIQFTICIWSWPGLPHAYDETCSRADAEPWCPIAMQSICQIAKMSKALKTRKCIWFAAAVKAKVLNTPMRQDEGHLHEKLLDVM